MATDNLGERFPEEVLFILGAARNDTGLSPERARLLTGAILIELRGKIQRLFGGGVVAKAAAVALLTELDLYRDPTTIPRQIWETQDD